MTAVAASNPSATPTRASKPSGKPCTFNMQAADMQSRQYTKSPICKPRANYLKPKEIRKIRIIGFDLQRRLNYLKVGIRGRKHRAGVLHHDPRFRDQGRRTAGRPRR